VNLCAFLFLGLSKSSISLNCLWYMWQFFEWKMSLPVCMFRFPCWLISFVIASFSICMPAMLAGSPA